MRKLSPKEIAEYFDRSFKAVDGLWFMKVEEMFGFDSALELDVRVWEVLPKIQARKLLELLKQKRGKEAFVDCFETKLQLDGYVFQKNEGLSWSLTECPWLKLLQKSGREHLADKIGARICKTEFGVFANEFIEGASVDFECRICKGDGECRFSFKENKAE